MAFTHTTLSVHDCTEYTAKKNKSKNWWNTNSTTHAHTFHTWPYRKRFTKKNQEKKRKKNTTTEPVNEYIYISVINQLFLFGKSNQHTPRAHAYSYIMRRFLIVIHNLYFHNHRPLHQQSNGSDWMKNGKQITIGGRLQNSKSNCINDGIAN